MPFGIALGATLMYLQTSYTLRDDPLRLFGTADVDIYSTLGMVLIVSMVTALGAPRFTKGVGAVVIVGSAPLFGLTFFSGRVDALMPLTISVAIIMIAVAISTQVPSVKRRRMRSTKALVSEIQAYRAMVASA